MTESQQPDLPVNELSEPRKFEAGWARVLEPMPTPLRQMREMLEKMGRPGPGVVEIPPAFGHIFHICATCHRWYWRRDAYRGHWLLVHYHKMAQD